MTEGVDSGRGKRLASQSTASLKSMRFKCMARSMAPPPPAASFPLKNFGPLTETVPRGVRHLAGSCASGRAPTARRMTDEFGEGDEPSAVAAVNRVDEEGGGQSGLAAPGRASRANAAGHAALTAEERDTPAPERVIPSAGANPAATESASGYRWLKTQPLAQQADLFQHARVSTLHSPACRATAWVR